ncbi:MAG TPA: acetoin utilization protein AcuC [Gammaproteobacteria bacterium]|nr:acetoin utilization protein AcuC [Gammaproteobacteria bacterium]
MAAGVGLFYGDALRSYAFGHGHPFGPDRLDAFWSEAKARNLPDSVLIFEPETADRSDIERFHTAEYVDWVIQRSKAGDGFLDYGDTPAYPGIYEAASTIVGTTLAACRAVMSGDCRRAFIPIAGLHHARRDAAAGFCAFNDCGVTIETLKQSYGLTRVGYVDIDAHHGDGVYYGFEDDDAVVFADLHEDGRFLYPGTGAEHERGIGAAKGTKLNIPMPPDAGDRQFFEVWEQVEAFIANGRPQFILFQCGADSVSGDPITHLRYSTAAHAHAATRLCALADDCCQGRLLAMGGGGYNRRNLALAWCAVLEAMIAATPVTR